MDVEQDLYSIDELADLGGVSRRTVRYYVQEGLLPAPLGVGRARHYGRPHLDRLLEVKAWQEAGLSPDDIRARHMPPSGGGKPAPRLSQPPPRSTWQRCATVNEWIAGFGEGIHSHIGYKREKALAAGDASCLSNFTIKS